jgi:hypothetical protein
MEQGGRPSTQIVERGGPTITWVLRLSHLPLCKHRGRTSTGVLGKLRKTINPQCLDNRYTIQILAFRPRRNDELHLERQFRTSMGTRHRVCGRKPRIVTKPRVVTKERVELRSGKTRPETRRFHSIGCGAHNAAQARDRYIPAHICSAHKFTRTNYFNDLDALLRNFLRLRPRPRRPRSEALLWECPMRLAAS